SFFVAGGLDLMSIVSEFDDRVLIRAFNTFNHPHDVQDHFFQAFNHPHDVQDHGAMMAHHYNPRGADYGIITRGERRIQIAFPNGTSEMDMDVKVGDVFWVPQYYPVCHIAARSGPLEFFGFTTSARGNRPQPLT
ncbi:hypothetical protein KI387_017698, partial [Taxus chinensis]